MIGIIGSNGFVGSHLKIDNAVCFDRDNINVLDKSSLGKLSGIDTLIYLVKGNREVITKGLENTLEVAERVGVKKVIYLSSIVVFGENPQEGINDDSPLKLKQDDEYAQAKVDAEAIVEKYRKNMNIIIIRPGYVYGEGGLDHTIFFLNQIKKKDIYLPYNGMGAFNGVYVRNLVHLIKLAIDSDVKNENFNGVDGFSLIWRDLFESYARKLDTHIDEINKNNVEIINSKWIFRIKRLLYPKRKFVSKSFTNVYSWNYHFKMDKAKSLLNYSPVYSFQEAMDEINA